MKRKNVIDEQQNILPPAVAEVFGHGQAE